MNGRISSSHAGRYLARVACATVLLTAMAATAVTAAGATPRGVVAAARVKPFTSKRPNCSSFFPVATISSLLGGPSYLERNPAFTANSDYWRAAIPGSACLYFETTSPSDYPSDSDNSAWVYVGYGESLTNWRKLSAYFKSEAIVFDTYPAPWSALKVSGAAQAFLNTFDISSYYQVTPAESPDFPIYVYVVTVLTKRHNVLQVGIMTTSLATTVAQVNSLLARDRAWF